MKKYNKIYYRIIFVTMCFVLSSVFMLISGAESLAKSKGIKLRYNGKTSVNRSKQMSVTYQNKKVSKKAWKSRIIDEKDVLEETKASKGNAFARDKGYPLEWHVSCVICL